MTTQTQPKVKTYQLHKNELVRNSPYTVEGSNVVLDVPPQRNIPHKFVVTITGPDGLQQEREVRYIRGAQSIYVDEQIKAGIKADRKPTPQEFLDLTFVHGRLEARRPNLIEYVDVLPLNEFGKAEKQLNQKIMYTVYDEKAIKKAQRSEADKQIQAYTVLRALNYDQMKDALRLRGTKAVMDEDDSFLALKNIIEAAKDGIDYMIGYGEKVGIVTEVTAMEKVEGEAAGKGNNMTEYDNITSMVFKLIEADIISLQSIPNSVAIVDKNNKSKILTKLEDGGDLTAKTERFIDFVVSDPATQKILQTRVAELEKK